METKHPADNSVEKRKLLFNRYVVPHLNLVYKLCIRYSLPAGDIEDNYSEVLINFFKYIGTYDPSRSIQTWLHIVTKRFVGEMNHRNSLFKRDNDTDVAMLSSRLPEEEGGGNGMDETNYRRFYSDDVLEALERLKPIYREALLLQQAGYKLEEIMEISYRNGHLKTKNIETIKSRLFLAKQQMRQLITRHGERRKN